MAEPRFSFPSRQIQLPIINSQFPRQEAPHTYTDPNYLCPPPLQYTYTTVNLAYKCNPIPPRTALASSILLYSLQIYATIVRDEASRVTLIRLLPFPRKRPPRRPDEALLLTCKYDQEGRRKNRGRPFKKSNTDGVVGHVKNPLATVVRVAWE